MGKKAGSSSGTGLGRPMEKEHMSKRFDVIIIGGGNAGFGVSSVVSEAGKSIAFIERAEFGGVCPNRGCTPKKILVAAAHALHEIERAHVHGIQVGPARLDWAALIDREKEMIASIPDSMKGLAGKRGTVYQGEARFVGPNAVDVSGTALEAEHVVVATGSKPRALPIPGAEHMITSDEVLSERTLPAEVVFVGGGVIAMEFSHVYARAGARVTILEVAPRLLGNMDEDAVAQMRKESERIGVTVETGVSVDSIESSHGRLRVTWSRDGASHTIETDRVVNGAGRVADVDELNLEAARVDHDGVRIIVDEHLRSVSNPQVWVCGDALVGPPQLSPVATYEGQIVGRNIVEGASTTPDYSAVPSGVYTVPALGSVGLTEAQAAEKELDVDVAVNDLGDWFSARTYGETVAWSKVLVDRASDRIVGAHIIGHHGEDLIHLFAMAMKHGIPASALRSAVYGFPSFAADVKNMV